MSALKNILFIPITMGFIYFGLYLADIEATSMVKFSSLSFLLGIHLGLMLAAYPIAAHKTHIGSTFSDKLQSRVQGLKTLSYLDTLGSLSLLAGVLGFFLAMAFFLVHFAEPEKVGPAVALGLLCLGYAFLGRIIASTLRERVLDKVAGLDDASSVASTPNATTTKQNDLAA